MITDSHPRTILHIRIRPTILERFRQQAKKERRTQTEVLEEAIRYYLSDHSLYSEEKRTGT